MKILLTLLFVLNMGLYAGGGSLFNNLTNILDSAPEWLKDYKNGDLEAEDEDTIYFVGISTLYSPQQKKEAYQGARSSGLGQIAGYINVSVNSSLDVSTNVDGDNVNESSSANTKMLSFVDLDGVVPDKEYIAEDGDGIVAYALFKMSKRDLAQKKQKYTQLANEYKALISECYDAIQHNQVEEANSLFKKLQGFKQSKFDPTFQVLKKDLNSFFKVNILTNIKEGKKFKINESVKLTLRPTKSLYVYVLLEYGNTKKVKVIYPNQRDNNNFIRQKESKTLKIKTKKKYLSKTDNTIILYASSSPIPFTDYVNEKYELPNAEDARWRVMIQDKEDNTRIYKKVLHYKVEDKKEKKRTVCIKKDGDGFLARNLYKESKSILKKSFKIKKSCKKVDFEIVISYENSIEYVEALNRKIRQIEYSYSVEGDDEEIYSSDEKDVEVYYNMNANEAFKEIRKDVKSILKEIVATIKEDG